jgi:hypothetical protein
MANLTTGRRSWSTQDVKAFVQAWNQHVDQGGTKDTLCKGTGLSIVQINAMASRINQKCKEMGKESPLKHFENARRGKLDWSDILEDADKLTA